MSRGEGQRGRAGVVCGVDEWPPTPCPYLIKCRGSYKLIGSGLVVPSRGRERAWRTMRENRRPDHGVSVPEGWPFLCTTCFTPYVNHMA